MTGSASRGGELCLTFEVENVAENPKGFVATVSFDEDGMWLSIEALGGTVRSCVASRRGDTSDWDLGGRTECLRVSVPRSSA